MLEKLFIYGSLCEGMIHHKIIKDSIISTEPALVKGSVYRLDIGFPVFLSAGNSSVKGYLVSLKPSEILGAILDEFHGVNHRQLNRSIHTRVDVQVMTALGFKEAKAYVLNPKKLPKSAVPIVHGDWELDFKSQQPLEERFTEEEICYLAKIGKTTGRDVIQYTPLTRELEKKGLVVDKGRRPALTPLGREVYKYLDL